MALTKAEMAEHLFEKLGVNKRDSKDLVEAFFEEIKGSLRQNEICIQENRSMTEESRFLFKYHISKSGADAGGAILVEQSLTYLIKLVTLVINTPPKFFKAGT